MDGDEPGYWITSHWAHGLHNPDELPWHLYRKELKRRDHEVKVGHRILFYECRRTKNSVDRLHEGVRTQVELGPGAVGIVRAGRIVGDRRPIRSDDLVYDYGEIGRWKYLTPCRVDATGLIPLADIWSDLRRQIPPQRFGLLRIQPDEYDRLFARLRPIG